MGNLLFCLARSQFDSIDKVITLKRKRYLSALVVLTFLTSLLVTLVPGVASADESMPNLQWSPVSIANQPLAYGGPEGSITIGCRNDGSAGSSFANLRTYDASGQLVRNIDHTATIDGVPNCIQRPVVDKNGVVYGIPEGGPNLLAYDGNTLKWKYAINPFGNVVVGANGNLYTTTSLSDGAHLVGISSSLEAGQSQPAKVLDVNISYVGKLYAHKYGIVLDDFGTMRFYNYAGKLLRQVNVGYGSGSRVDDRGRMFTPRNVYSAGKNTASIVTFSVHTNPENWTYSFGVNTWIYSDTMRPLPGGGVVAIVDQPVMVAPGVPASPPQWETVLAVINPAGQKVRDVPISMTDAQGNQLDIPTVMVDDGGNVVMVRSMTAVGSGGSTAQGVSVGVYNVASNIWPYQDVVAGDPDDPSGSSNYQFQRMVEDDPLALSQDTVAITVSCWGNCDGDYSYKLYALDVPGIGMDYPRGAVINTAPRPSAVYVALGDSFSAGEGVTPFDSGTDTPGVNTCHRSEQAYPRLLAEEHENIPSLGANGFRACSGAVTDNIGNRVQWNEGVQIDVFPDDTTQLVTMTIGGNDIGFADFAKACVYPTSSCDFGSSAYNTSLNKINNELQRKLEATYREVLRYTPNADIYVIGYPQVIANKSVNDSDDSRCFYMQGGSSNWSEARAARDIVTKLNGKIDAAVAQVQGENPNNQRLTYVPLDEPGSPFIGHEVCGTSSTSWFQNIDQATHDPAYVFHPNDLGQEAFATVVGATISAG